MFYRVRARISSLVDNLDFDMCRHKIQLLVTGRAFAIINLNDFVRRFQLFSLVKNSATLLTDRQLSQRVCRLRTKGCQLFGQKKLKGLIGLKES